MSEKIVSPYNYENLPTFLIPFIVYYAN